jgi:hypothetical protein
MADDRGKKSFDKILRHMAENLNGAYKAVHPKGHPREDKRSTCSGTAIIACCYINGLGKVLLKGGPKKGTPRRDFVRFQEFLKRCMSDFLAESDSRGLPPLPPLLKSKMGGETGGDDWLYYTYRCGFVHGLPRAGVVWGWNRSSTKYWFEKNGRIGLNIDELVRGFHRGVEKFRIEADADDDYRLKFKEYLWER